MPVTASPPPAAHWARLINSLSAFWNRLTAPSPRITHNDERRQAALLAGLLIVLIPLAIINEAVTVIALTPLRTYTGYWVTVVAVIVLAGAYVVSRTRYYKWAVFLVFFVITAAIFVGGVQDPGGVQEGFLDFMLMAVLLASGFMRLRVVVVFGLVNLGLVFLVPLLNPVIPYDRLLIGTGVFNLIGFTIIVFITRYRDLQERDRLADLAEKEARYRTLVELMPAVTYLDVVPQEDNGPLKYASIYISPQVEALLGYTVAQMLAEPNLWWDRVHPDDKPGVLAATAKYVTIGDTMAHEYRLIAADGAVHWVRDVATLRLDPAGRRLSQGLWIETTDTHLAAARLRQEVTRTAALLRVANRLNALLDEEAVLNTLCEETYRALGTDAAGILLYDPQRDLLVPAAARGQGVQGVELPPIPRQVQDLFVARQGADVLITDWQAEPELGRLKLSALLNIRSLAYASVQHEGRLLGGLTVFNLREIRVFTEDDRLLLRGLADQAALSLMSSRLYQDAQRRLERLQALRAIDIAISSHQSLPETLDVLLEQITRQLDVSAALVLLTESDGRHLVYAAGRGFNTVGLQVARLPWGGEHAGRAAREQRVVAVPDLHDHLDSFARADRLQAEGFVSYFAAPLIIKGEVRGVIELFDRVRQGPDPEWLSFLEALAGQAAIAIDNTTLVDDLQRSNLELAQAYDATIEGWSRALDLRDHETEGHTRRVTELSVALARWVGGFTPAELVHLRRGALLHDIGKMGIPDSILLKEGPLDDAEWVVMRRHPQLAHDMLSTIAYLRPALDIPLAHHEWWNGAGYPHGLAGEAIPRAARLFAIIDVWDALRSDRPYRRAWPEAKVRAYLTERAGTQFDPALLAAFLEMQAARLAAV